MTKPKKWQYQIQYVDNTYRVVDWTKAEYNEVGQSIMKDKSALVLDDGIFILRDIRAIVLIPEPEVEEIEEDATPKEEHLTEWGFVDHDTAQWLKAQGIEIGGSK